MQTRLVPVSCRPTALPSNLRIHPDSQAALAVPGADAQQQVAEAHRRTTKAMMALRSTLRDEHYYLLQACPLPDSLVRSMSLLQSDDVIVIEDNARRLVAGSVHWFSVETICVPRASLAPMLSFASETAAQLGALSVELSPRIACVAIWLVHMSQHWSTGLR